MQFQLSGTPQKRGFSCACVLCLPQPERFRQPEAWGPSPQVRGTFSLRASGPSSQRLGRPLPGCGTPFPSAAPARAAGRVSGSLQIGNGGLFAVWEGVASLGLSLPLSPLRCLLPPAGMGRLFSGVSQYPCFANLRPCVQAG